MSPARSRRGARPEDPPDFLRRLGVSPRKALGQHFLTDELLLARIADACELGPEETVIEVGVGPGGLTRELVERTSSVVGVEIDEELAAIARRQLAGSGVCIVPADILDVTPEELLEECGAAAPYVMTGNLPYYITQPVIRRFLESDPAPRRLVVMVQREVARRMVGGPGKESVLSLSIGAYGEPELLFDVPSSAFWPEPDVQSAVVRIDRRPAPAVSLPPEQMPRFFVLVRAGFVEPRKQLHNGLRSALDLSRDQTHAVLDAAGIDPALRAQHLDLDDWQRLFAHVEETHPEALDLG